MNTFATKLTLRIDWSEMDLLGHVNNLAILKYAQAARVNYLEGMGLMHSQAAIKIGPILAWTSCQFRKPLFYPGQVTVHSRVDYIKDTSLKMLHEIYNEQGEIAAEIEDIIVLYDFSENTKITIPDEFRERIGSLEGPR